MAQRQAHSHGLLNDAAAAEHLVIWMRRQDEEAIVRREDDSQLRGGWFCLTRPASRKATERSTRHCRDQRAADTPRPP